MPYLIDRIRGEDLALFAINTGEWYKLHCSMYGEGIDPWRDHVRSVVVPAYKKQFPDTENSAFGVFVAALELKDYYDRHTEEEMGYWNRREREDYLEK